MSTEDELCLDSESDSEIENILLCFYLKRRKKCLGESTHLKKRRTHGEFNLLSDLSDVQIKQYFRVTRLQFQEIHDVIKENIQGIGCNARQPIDTEMKLAVCLR